MEGKWITEQAELRSRCVLIDDFAKDLKYIGGVDISFVKDTDKACAALVVLRYPDCTLVYEEYELVEMTLPYIPGFLGFREIPALKLIFDRVRANPDRPFPDVVLVDGNGILHPRSFGLACHLGVVVDVPCIGVGKNLFQVDGLRKDKLKDLEYSPGNERASFRFAKLIGDSGAVLGAAVLTVQDIVNPIFVSIGHRISLESALTIVEACSFYRVPEPVRQADILTRAKLRLAH